MAGIGFVCTTPVVLSPARAGKLGLFCTIDPGRGPRPARARPSPDTGAQIGFVLRIHPSSLAPPGPAGNWVRFVQNWPPWCVVPQMAHPTQVWLRFAHFAFRGPGDGRNWVRFTRLLPVPQALPPPGAAGNWVRFAQSARRGQGRKVEGEGCPSGTAGRNWVCFAQLLPGGSSRPGRSRPFPSTQRPIGFVLRNRPPGASRAAPNWVRFAHLPPRPAPLGPRPTGLRPGIGFVLHNRPAQVRRDRLHGRSLAATLCSIRNPQSRNPLPSAFKS